MRKKYIDMTKKERIAAVRELMAQGHTNESAADELGTTPGAIAGIRWREKIPSKNPAHGKKPGVRRPHEWIRTKMAASEADQCTYVEDELRCGAEREPGSEFCKKHQPS